MWLICDRDDGPAPNTAASAPHAIHEVEHLAMRAEAWAPGMGLARLPCPIPLPAITSDKTLRQMADSLVEARAFSATAWPRNSTLDRGFDRGRSIRRRKYLSPPDHLSSLPGKIPGAVRVTIPDAGHASNRHQPVAFNSAVAEFLGGLPAAT